MPYIIFDADVLYVLTERKKQSGYVLNTQAISEFLKQLAPKIPLKACELHICYDMRYESYLKVFVDYLKISRLKAYFTTSKYFSITTGLTIAQDIQQHVSPKMGLSQIIYITSDSQKYHNASAQGIASVKFYSAGDINLASQRQLTKLYQLGQLKQPCFFADLDDSLLLRALSFNNNITTINLAAISFLKSLKIDKGLILTARKALKIPTAHASKEIRESLKKIQQHLQRLKQEFAEELTSYQQKLQLLLQQSGTNRVEELDSLINKIEYRQLTLETFYNKYEKDIADCNKRLILQERALKKARSIVSYFSIINECRAANFNLATFPGSFVNKKIHSKMAIIRDYVVRCKLAKDRIIVFMDDQDSNMKPCSDAHYLQSQGYKISYLKVQKQGEYCASIIEITLNLLQTIRELEAKATRELPLTFYKDRVTPLLFSSSVSASSLSTTSSSSSSVVASQADITKGGFINH